MEAIIILFVVLVIAVMVYGFYAAAQRRKALAAWAASRGLTYADRKDYSIEEQFPAFDCFQEGSDRYAFNIISGGWNGRGLLGFDYHYETESTDSKGRRTTHDHYFSAVILESAVPLKGLFIRPEGFFDKVTQFFGFDDIDFESAEFSRKFYVKGPDRKWAYDVIHPRTMEFLLASPRFTIEFAPFHVVAHHSDRFEPAEFEDAARLIEGLLDRLPEYLIRQQTGQG